MVSCWTTLTVILCASTAVLSSPLHPQQTYHHTHNKDTQTQQLLESPEYEDDLTALYSPEDMLNLYPHQFYQDSSEEEDDRSEVMEAGRRRPSEEPVFYRNILGTRIQQAVPEEELPWYSDSVDSVDIWPEHVEALQRQRYLEQPMGQDQGYLEQPTGQDQGYLEQPEEHNYLEQIFLEHPEDQIYLEQPQDQGYLEPQADDLSYPVASQDQSYNEEEEEVVGSYLQQHPEASNYLEEPRAGLESWYHQSSSGSQAVEEDGQLEEELHAAEKEKRSSENMEGYRLYQAPAISSRKSTKAPPTPAVASTTAQSTAAAAAAAATLMPAEKRGMPETPILRPGSASDPRFSSLPAEARPKRSLKRPVPFSNNADVSR